MDEYSYQPLESTDVSFRILTVQPLKGSNSKEILECSLQNAEIRPGPAHDLETISYYWGDPKPNKLIRIDGKSLMVALNAERTLRQIASLHSQPRKIWIDAVCIKQEDLAERSQQVQRMASIYALAKGNLIMLGDIEDEALAVRAICNINAIVEEIRGEVGELHKLWDLVAPDGTFAFAHSEVRTVLDLTALIYFYSIPWFRRLWVVQEAVLARRNTCIYGNHTIEFPNVLAVAAWLYRYHAPQTPSSLRSAAGLSNVASMWELISYRAAPSHNGMKVPNSLTFTLQNSIRLECMDPRDKVYGMLGLTVLPGEAIPALLKPDYEKPVFQVFRDATRHCIQRMSHLYILRYVLHQHDQDLSNDGFPTWVPRFDRQRVPNSEPLPMSYRYAAGMWNSGEQSLGAALDDEDLLILQGVRIDEVQIVSKMLGGPDSKTFWEPFMRFMDIADNHFKLRFAKALTAGVDHHHNPASDAYYETFHYWLAHCKSKRGPLGVLSELPTNADEALRKATQFNTALNNVARIRCWATTNTGLMALVPAITKPGDVVANFKAGNVPFAFRPIEGDEYHLIGGVYLEYHMDGVAFTRSYVEGEPLTTFRVR